MKIALIAFIIFFLALAIKSCEPITSTDTDYARKECIDHGGLYSIGVPLFFKDGLVARCRDGQYKYLRRHRDD